MKYEEIFQRDGYKCRHCLSRSGLQAHHVIYRSHLGGDLPNNILILCYICHSAHHNGNLQITVTDKLKDNLIVKFIRKGGWKP